MHKRSRFYFMFFLAVVLLSAASCKRGGNGYASLPDLHQKHKKSPALKSMLMLASDSSSLAERKVQLEEYDLAGHKTHEVHYDSAGKPESESFFTYDKNGRLLNTRTVDDGNKISTERNTLDASGRVARTNWMTPEGDSGSYEYKYDTGKNVVQMDVYDKGNFMISRLYPNIYNEKGKIAQNFYKETRNGHDTNFIEATQYLYDTFGRVIAKQTLNSYRIPVSLENYIYDSSGDKIIELHRIPDTEGKGLLTVAQRIIYTYNAFGDITEEQSFKDNAPEYTRDNTYDEYGHLLTAEYHYADGRYRKEKYVYEYYK
jgi:hypothetical protein